MNRLKLSKLSQFPSRQSTVKISLGLNIQAS